MTIAYDQNFESSNIQGLAYDKKAGLAYVEFKGGRRFAYKMTATIFKEMRDAKSIGSFFAKNVKGKCAVAWVGACCDNSPCRDDATLQGEVAGNKFVVCESCSQIARMANVQFSPIPDRANGGS